MGQHLSAIFIWFEWSGRSTITIGGATQWAEGAERERDWLVTVCLMCLVGYVNINGSVLVWEADLDGNGRVNYNGRWRHAISLVGEEIDRCPVYLMCVCCVVCYVDINRQALIQHVYLIWLSHFLWVYCAMWVFMHESGNHPKYIKLCSASSGYI